MLEGLKQFVASNHLFDPGRRILLAVSGGLDSVVMAELFSRAGWRFGIAHCNFGLRGAESDEDERFVEELAKKLRVPFHTRRFLTSEDAEEKKISIQMAARELRYQWFEELRVREEYDFTATAHHLDDQAETVFINLLRGTGLSGLHGILPKQGTLIRPMMFAFRADFERFAAEHHIHFREDSSNSSNKYLRNRIRKQLIPLLKDMNPDFSQTMAENINRFREAGEVYLREINRVRQDLFKKEKHRFVIDTGKLKELRPAATFLYELLSPYGFNEAHVKDLLRSMDNPERKLFESTYWTLEKGRSQLVLSPRMTGTATEHRKEYRIRKGQGSLFVPVRLTIRELPYTPGMDIPAERETASLDADKLEFPLRLKRWHPGDSFLPFGLNKKKKVSDFFIDSKLSSIEKENVWLLWSRDKIAWIIGMRIDNRFRVTPKTKRILRITSKNS